MVVLKHWFIIFQKIYQLSIIYLFFVHQKIIQKLVKESKKMNVKSAILGFDPHPQQFFTKNYDGFNVINEKTTMDDMTVICSTYNCIPENDKYKFELIYSIEFDTRISIGPAKYICYVSATTGELLMRKNTVLYEAPAPITHVEGELYTTHPYNPATVEDLVNLKIENNNNGSTYYTDNNGNVNINANLGTSLTYKLEGLYAQVQTNNNVPEFTQALNTSGNVSFDNSNSTIQERTAYRAVNVIHTHLKSVFPTFTALDIPLETNLDEAGTCNAYYSGNSINFYAEGLSANGTDYCENTGKISDVVYHEYGHAINGNRYNSGTGMWNGALNEGFADIWAFTITLDPILGIGFYQNNPNGYVRRFDINKKVKNKFLEKLSASDAAKLISLITKQNKREIYDYLIEK